MAVHSSGSPNGCHALGPAVRRAVLRVLTVVALALAGLLVFGLLPGGRDAPMVLPGLYPLPSVAVARDLHPYGPNRPLTGSWPGADLEVLASPDTPGTASQVASASEPVHPASWHRH